MKYKDKKHNDNCLFWNEFLTVGKSNIVEREIY